MSSEPVHSVALLHGRLLMSQGRFDEAEQRFREALGASPDDAESLHGLAFCQYRQDGGSARALETIRAALALRPNLADHHSLRALILADLERPDEAAASAGEAIALAPDSAFAHNAMTVVRLTQRDWAEAEACARNALALDAEDSLAANHLSIALRMQGRREENAAQIRGLLARDPEDASTHMNAGWSALEDGRRVDAEDHFLQALRIDPGHEYARQGLLTAFKARSPLYRVHLRFALFMGRLTNGRQWLVIIGLWLAFKAVRLLQSTPLAYVALAAVPLYLLFVVWQHVADGVGHLIVLLDRRARRVLRAPERWDGILVGGLLLAGLVLLPAGLLLRQAGLIVAGGSLMAAAMPAAHVCRNTRLYGRAFFAGVALLVAGVGVATAVMLSAGRPLPPLLTGVAPVAMLLWVASTWLANVPALRRME